MIFDWFRMSLDRMLFNRINRLVSYVNWFVIPKLFFRHTVASN